jgi:carbon storage regulator
MIRRRSGESVLLGENIEIHVLEVAGNRVKLGISAPREMLVLRNELMLTEEFNREASRAVPASHLVTLATAIAKTGSVAGPGARVDVGSRTAVWK